MSKGDVAMRHGYILFVCALVLTADVALMAEEKQQGFSYDDYADALKNYVDDTGTVNYKKLKARPEKLEAFIAAMSKLDTGSYDKWKEKEQIAFWLNAYNALTLKAIIDNYPIKSSFLRSRVWPKNSIRQIPGVWKKITFRVTGQNLTLGHIEDKILRVKFDEPRIHMALVCAAMGCPPLRNGPYAGEKLDEQLDDQTRRFLANPAKFKIERGNNTLHLSSIFDWFAGDFVKKHSPAKNIGKHKKKTSAVLNFIAPHLGEAHKDYVLAGKFKIKYVKYDWSLNEQQRAKK
jgi:hypothetical protein